MTSLSASEWEFEGLEAIEESLARHAEDIGYIVVLDRTSQSQDEMLGRFDFDELAARPFAEPGEEDEPDALWSDEASEPPVGLPGLSAAEIAQAASQWIRDLAMRCTLGEAYLRFRVKMWAPKGHRMVDSGQFVCRNLDGPSAPPVPVRPVPPRDIDELAAPVTVRSLEALGRYYEQWGAIVIGSVHQLQGIHNQTTLKLHRQLSESRAQTDQLVASILESRISEVADAEARQLEARETDTRTALARDALQQVGEAAKALLGAQVAQAAGGGSASEWSDLLGVLGRSPALLETLKDPSVRTLIDDPSTLDQIAMMLRAAAVQQTAPSGSPPSNRPAGEGDG